MDIQCARAKRITELTTLTHRAQLARLTHRNPMFQPTHGSDIFHIIHPPTHSTTPTQYAHNVRIMRVMRLTNAMRVNIMRMIRNLWIIHVIRIKCVCAHKALVHRLYRLCH